LRPVGATGWAVARVEGYRPVDSFDETNAARYDDRAVRGDEDAAVAFLYRLAGDGRALELAVGTGRIALPLAARGVPVDGIDLSAPMVARLRAKAGGERIHVTLGDFVALDLPGRYRLVYVVFNSFFNVLTQDDQVRSFERVAAHLTDDGVFVIEAFVPSFLVRLDHDQYARAEGIEVDEVRLDLLRHDGATQTIEESHVSLSATGIRFNPVVQRYAWPAELDLMARLAGLSLRERWGGWSGERFTSASDLHVSVYTR
jgi:SAM-dependent methyltransferase